MGDDYAARMAFYLEEKATQLRTRGLDAQVRIVHGDPVQAIVDYDELMQAGIIVMTTQGSSGPCSLWISPVASDVARQATSPVLLVPSYLRGKLMNQARSVGSIGDESAPVVAAFNGSAAIRLAPVGARSGLEPGLPPELGFQRELAPKG